MEHGRKGKLPRPSNLEWWNEHPGIGKGTLIVASLGSLASIGGLVSAMGLSGFYSHLRTVLAVSASVALLLFMVPVYLATTKTGIFGGLCDRLLTTWILLESGTDSPALEEGTWQHEQTVQVLHSLRYRVYIPVSIDPKDHIGRAEHQKLGRLVHYAGQASNAPWKVANLRAARKLYREALDGKSADSDF